MDKLMMDKITLIAGVAFMAAGMTSYAYGAEQGQSVRSQSEVTADAISQAQDRLVGSRNLKDQIDQGRGRSDQIQAVIRNKAATLVAQTRGKAAEQMRHDFAGNVDVANAERRPCADPPPSPPADGPGLCQPGVRAH